MPKSFKKLTQEDHKRQGEFDRLLDLWRLYFKLKKFNMQGTGNLDLDRKVLETCGDWSKSRNITGVEYKLDVQVIDQIYNDLDKDLTVLTENGISNKNEFYELCYQLTYNEQREYANEHEFYDWIKGLMDKYRWKPSKVLYKIR